MDREGDPLADKDRLAFRYVVRGGNLDIFLNVEAAAFEHIDDLLFEFFDVLFAEEFLGLSEDDRDFERVGLDFRFGVSRNIDVGQGADVDRAILGGKRQDREPGPRREGRKTFSWQGGIKDFCFFVQAIDSGNGIVRKSDLLTRLLN